MENVPQETRPHVFFARLATISGLSDPASLEALTRTVLAELRAMVAPSERNYVRQQLPEPLRDLWGPLVADPLAEELVFYRPEAAELIAKVGAQSGVSDAKRAVMAAFVVLDEALADPAVVTLLQSVSPSVKHLWVNREAVLDDLRL